MRRTEILGWLMVVVVEAWFPPSVCADGPCEHLEPGGPGDCNANGFLDECDLGPHALGYAVRELYNPQDALAYDTSLDTAPITDSHYGGDGDTKVGRTMARTGGSSNTAKGCSRATRPFKQVGCAGYDLHRFEVKGMQ